MYNSRISWFHRFRLLALGTSICLLVLVFGSPTNLLKDGDSVLYLHDVDISHPAFKKAEVDTCLKTKFSFFSALLFLGNPTDVPEWRLRCIYNSAALHRNIELCQYVDMIDGATASDRKICLEKASDAQYREELSWNRWRRADF